MVHGGKKNNNKNARYVQQYLTGRKQSCSTCRSVLMTGNDPAARVPHGSGRITDNNRAAHA